MVIGLLAVLCISAQALTIESKDIGYIPGHTYDYTVVQSAPTKLDLTKGTGKKWNFTSYSGSYYYKITRIYNVSNNSNFPEATLAVDYSGKTISSFSGTTYLKEKNGDLLTIGGISSGYKTEYTPYTQMGLPHDLGKKWSITYTVDGYSQTQNAEVIAEGTVITSMGTFQAVLVKSTIESSNTYNWETKEYGLIAYAFTPNNYIYVMTSGTRNVGVKFKPATGSSKQSIFSCQSIPGFILIKSKVPAYAQVYSVNGKLLASADVDASTSWQATSGATGMYIIRFASPLHNVSQGVIVQK